MYKITADSVYTIDVENEKGQITTLSIDATDIGQIDALLTMFTDFDKITQSLEKRSKKAQKDYPEESVYVRQLVRITKEEIAKIDGLIDGVFGEVSKDIFLGRLSISAYLKFFSMLEKEFQPAIEKGKKSFEQIIGKYEETKEEGVL